MFVKSTENVQNYWKKTIKIMMFFTIKVFAHRVWQVTWLRFQYFFLLSKLIFVLRDYFFLTLSKYWVRMTAKLWKFLYKKKIIHWIYWKICYFVIRIWKYRRIIRNLTKSNWRVSVKNSKSNANLQCKNMSLYFVL